MQRFQGQEFNDDFGVDIYEFKYRVDDPQIDRFWQVDPLADKYVYNRLMLLVKIRLWLMLNWRDWSLLIL